MAGVVIRHKREPMDALSCNDIGGKFDVGEGKCNYDVAVDKDGNEVFIEHNK